MLCRMDGIQSKNVKHLADIVGEWGKWQLHFASFCFILWGVAAINNMGYTFHAFPNDYWCSDVPVDYKNKTEHMKCFQFNKPNESCTEWHYDRKQFRRSIVTEFDLVCDRSNIASFTQTSYMMSYLITGLLLAYLSDKFGRKPVIWLSFVAEVCGTISCGLSVNVYQYMASRFFVGLGASGRGSAINVMIIEFCGPKHRSDINILSGLGWIIGYASIPGIAYLLQDFRSIQLYSLLPMLLMMIWFYWIDESPRWQITAGRRDQAELTLRKALKWNGKSDENLTEQLAEWSAYLESTKTDNETKEKVTLVDLLRAPNLRKYTIVLSYLGIVNALIYYGFSHNMTDFGGNIYITFLLSALVELPSALSVGFLLRFIGRNKLFAIYMFVITGASVGVIFSESTSLRVTFALIGKFGINSSWIVKGMHQHEIFPTILRNTGNGFLTVTSRIGAVGGPFMKNLAADTSLAVVMILYASLTSIAAMVGFILPETKDKEIPDTIEEAENLSSRYRKSKANKLSLKTAENSTQNTNYCI